MSGPVTDPAVMAAYDAMPAAARAKLLALRRHAAAMLNLKYQPEAIPMRVRFF